MKYEVTQQYITTGTEGMHGWLPETHDFSSSLDIDTGNERQKAMRRWMCLTVTKVFVRVFKTKDYYLKSGFTASPLTLTCWNEFRLTM